MLRRGARRARMRGLRAIPPTPFFDTLQKSRAGAAARRGVAYKSAHARYGNALKRNFEAWKRTLKIHLGLFEIRLLHTENTSIIAVRATKHGTIDSAFAGVLGGAWPTFLEKKIVATFSKKNSLSRYDAARPRFSPYELCGARRFFGDPMALIRFTTTFFSTRPKTFGGAPF
jgi:hypothetical protein